MIASQAKRISSFCISNGIISEQDREKYDYCYEVMLSTLINIASVMMIGFATGFFAQTVCFLLVFALLKSTAGGYHAGSHSACFCETTATFLIFRILAAAVPTDILPTVAAALAVFTGITVFLLAPVGTENKPLGRRQAQRLQRDSRLLVLVLCMAVFFLTERNAVQWAFTVSSAAAAVAVSLIAGKRKLEKAEQAK